MKSFNIKIAQTVFSIETIFDDTFFLCKNYLVDEIGEKIVTTKADIEFEREKSKSEAILEGIEIKNYSDGYLETIAVYRKIVTYLSFKGSALFHGALIEKDGVGYLFTAKSGTGKTTHIRNWVKAFPQTKIINGDKPIISLKDNCAIAYGTPWCGKEGYNTNASTKIKAVIIVKRDTTNHIEKTSKMSVLSTMLTQIYKPNDDFGVKRSLEFVMGLLNKVDVYILYCNMDVESAIVAFNGIE